MSSQCLVTIATYNEMENLPRLLSAVFAILPDCHVLVVDDNSPDGTGRWCMEQAKHDKRLHVICRPGKLGLGTATICALQYAIKRGYKFAINMDADFSHPPKVLPKLLAAMEMPGKVPVDVAIASRYIPGGGVKGWNLARKFMSRGINLYARLLLGLPVRDCSGAFRCYRVETLKRLDFSRIRSRGYSFQEEILWHLKRAGARFVEVPFTFVDRTAGRSKINQREAMQALLILLRIWLDGVV